MLTGEVDHISLLVEILRNMTELENKNWKRRNVRRCRTLSQIYIDLKVNVCGSRPST